MSEENGSHLWKNSRSENWGEKWWNGSSQWKNSKPENRCEKLESLKILVWKMTVKNSNQKIKKNWTNRWNLKWVKKIVSCENNLRRKISRKLDSVKDCRMENWYMGSSTETATIKWYTLFSSIEWVRKKFFSWSYKISSRSPFHLNYTSFPLPKQQQHGF